MSTYKRNRRAAVANKINEKYKVLVKPEDLKEIKKNQVYYVEVGQYKIEVHYCNARTIRTILIP